MDNTKTFADLSRRDKERHILVAVDESENSKRAVMYLADFFCDFTDVFITLLNIIQDPSEDFFATDAERDKWIKDRKNSMNKKMNEYIDLLAGAGFKKNHLVKKIDFSRSVSIADEILKEQDKLRSCMVVVGRRGISNKEEFVFGSTSSKILHHARNGAVMVVE